MALLTNPILMNIYFITGIGVDRRIFKYISLQEDLSSGIEPLKSITIERLLYCKRTHKQQLGITAPECFISGR
jgi:hypothetical protein